VLSQTLVSISVGLPLITGVVSLFFYRKKVRSVIISLTVIALAGSAILLHPSIDFLMSPEPIFMNLILVVDFALLVLILMVKKIGTNVTIYTSCRWLK